MTAEPICDFQQLVKDLSLAIEVSNFDIDKQDFYDFAAKSGYPEYYRNRFGRYYQEKLLEHYISIKLLNLEKEDVLIDIAADQSYFAEYVSKMYDLEAYRQDIIYRKGISSSPSVPLVGGDAARLPFRDNYISKMTLHCSLEHFEGDSDILFLKESERVLKKGGKCVILPLYLGEDYHFVTDPQIEDGPDFPSNVMVYEREGFGNRQCRVYSLKEFKNRLVNSNGLSLKIYHIRNISDLGPDFYCCLAAVFEKI